MKTEITRRAHLSMKMLLIPLLNQNYFKKNKKLINTFNLAGQIINPKKPNINIPNQLRALAELLLSKSIPPAATTENGNRIGIRFI